MELTELIVRDSLLNDEIFYKINQTIESSSVYTFNLIKVIQHDFRLDSQIMQALQVLAGVRVNDPSQSSAIAYICRELYRLNASKMNFAKQVLQHRVSSYFIKAAVKHVLRASCEVDFEWFEAIALGRCYPKKVTPGRFVHEAKLYYRILRLKEWSTVKSSSLPAQYHFAWRAIKYVTEVPGMKELVRTIRRDVLTTMLKEENREKYVKFMRNKKRFVPSFAAYLIHMVDLKEIETTGGMILEWLANEFPSCNSLYIYNTYSNERDAFSEEHKPLLTLKEYFSAFAHMADLVLQHLHVSGTLQNKLQRLYESTIFPSVAYCFAIWARYLFDFTTFKSPLHHVDCIPYMENVDKDSIEAHNATGALKIIFDQCGIPTLLQIPINYRKLDEILVQRFDTHIMKLQAIRRVIANPLYDGDSVWA